MKLPQGIITGTTVCCWFKLKLAQPNKHLVWDQAGHRVKSSGAWSGQGYSVVVFLFRIAIDRLPRLAYSCRCGRGTFFGLEGT
jgi:hypothetical protein